MTVSKTASGIYQAAKKETKDVWNWRMEWSKAMKQAWRKVMEKISSARRSAERSIGNLERYEETTITGSDAQITWARNILEDFRKKAAIEIEDAVCRVDDGSMPKHWVYNVIDSATQIMWDFVSPAYEMDGGDHTICTGMYAGNIISKRGDLNIGRVNDLASQKYEIHNSRI